MSSPYEKHIQAPSGWNDFAVQLLDYAGLRRKFFFYGEMGAGKTTCIQALCRKLGVADGVLSPSFALVNEYRYPGGLVHHLDLFRLRDGQEALDIGVEDYLYDDDYCFVEWPELIEAWAPAGVLRIRIAQEGDSGRKVLFL